MKNLVSKINIFNILVNQFFEKLSWSSWMKIIEDIEKSLLYLAIIKYFFHLSSINFVPMKIAHDLKLNLEQSLNKFLTNDLIDFCPANFFIDFQQLDVLRIDFLSLTSVQKGSQFSVLYLAKSNWPSIEELRTKLRLIAIWVVSVYLELVGTAGKKIIDHFSIKEVSVKS